MFEKTRRGGGWRIVEWRLAMRKSAERTSKGKREGERCKMQEQQTHRDAKVSTSLHNYILVWYDTCHSGKRTCERKASQRIFHLSAHSIRTTEGCRWGLGVLHTPV